MKSLEKNGSIINLYSLPDMPHGRVEVFHVVPKNIQYSNTTFYCQPFNYRGLKESGLLVRDLNALAEGTKSSTVGVHYAGERSNSTRFAEGFSKEVKVTELQVAKAADIILAKKLLEAEKQIDTSSQTEYIGFSAGGPIAQLAALQDESQSKIVGLFNASCLDGRGAFRTTGRVLLHRGEALVRGPVDKRKDRIKYGEPEDTESLLEEKSRSRRDRLHRSFAESVALMRGQTHALIDSFPGTQYVIGNSYRDRIYPKNSLKKFLNARYFGENVSFVDLEWEDHVLGPNPSKRKDRLIFIGQKVKEARREGVIKNA